LSEKIPEVISLTGRMGAKETSEIFKRISETPAGRQLTLVATGKYIGEGFAVRNGIRVVVITRPAEDYRETDQVALQGTLAILQNAGIQMIFRPNIHQKFAVADQRIVWYGSINLLSFGSAEESIMRLESPAIAYGLMKTVYNS